MAKKNSVMHGTKSMTRNNNTSRVTMVTNSANYGGKRARLLKGINKGG